MANVTQVVDGLIEIIKRNIIAKTNLTENAVTGNTTITVENSFHFNAGEEIVLIDWGYNDTNSIHYNSFEYAQIKSIVDTRHIELSSAIISNWYVSDQSFIQKTIGHSPLYETNVYYGDREIVPTDAMAICIEPESLSNEWIYIQGGLSEEYRMKIMIYGKLTKTEDGMKILNKYSDAVYELLNKSLHIGIDLLTAPLMADALTGERNIVIQDTTENRENFVVSSGFSDPYVYVLQDNLGRSCEYFGIEQVTYGGGLITLKRMCPLDDNSSTDSLSSECHNRADFLMSEYGILIRFTRYFYDSRVDSINYGVVQKGSALLRAAELSWFAKEVNEHTFPQTYKNIPYAPDPSSSSISS